MVCTRFRPLGRLLHNEERCLSCTRHAYWSSIPIKYYQNMSKGIKVMERTRMRLRTDGRRTAIWIATRVSPEPIGRWEKVTKAVSIVKCPVSLKRLDTLRCFFFWNGFNKKKKKKKNAPSGSKFFYYCVVSFSDGDKTIWRSYLPWKCINSP